MTGRNGIGALLTQQFYDKVDTAIDYHFPGRTMDRDAGTPINLVGFPAEDESIRINWSASRRPVVARSGDRATTGADRRCPHRLRLPLSAIDQTRHLPTRSR